jgi:hypothetical protein
MTTLDNISSSAWIDSLCVVAAEQLDVVCIRDIDPRVKPSEVKLPGAGTSSIVRVNYRLRALLVGKVRPIWMTLSTSTLAFVVA